MFAKEYGWISIYRKDDTVSKHYLRKGEWFFLSDTENSLKYASEARDEAKDQIEHANVLLTALGVQEKDNHETDYYRKVLPVSTRIALYIAKKVTQ